VREVPSRAQIDRIRAGMVLSGGERLAPVRVDSPSARTLRLTLGQGVNRQIRRMCLDLGLTILKLVRTKFGPLSLGDLPKGECRPLDSREIAAIRAYCQRNTN
jgi:23S rRNA pseudouridine2605 synthase